MKIEFTIKIPTNIEEADLSIKQLSDDLVVFDPQGLPKFGVDKKVLLAALEKSQQLYNEHVKPTQKEEVKPEGSIRNFNDISYED